MSLSSQGQEQAWVIISVTYKTWEILSHNGEGKFIMFRNNSSSSSFTSWILFIFLYLHPKEKKHKYTCTRDLKQARENNKEIINTWNLCFSQRPPPQSEFPSLPQSKPPPLSEPFHCLFYFVLLVISALHQKDKNINTHMNQTSMKGVTNKSSLLGTHFFSRDLEKEREWAT